MRGLLSRPASMPAALLIVALAVGAALSPHFLDVYYLLDSTSLFAEAGLLVIAMTFVIVSGNIDLSVASTLVLTACVTAKLGAAGVPMVLAASGGIALGCALGALNGALIAYAKLPSFLVTLGTLALYRGAAQALMDSKSAPLPRGFVGIDRIDMPLTVLPLPLTLFLFLAAVLGFVLHRSVFGHYVFAVGTNPEAARFSGLPTERVIMKVFILSGLLAGLAGVMIDSRLGVARSDLARGLELDVITATVLAGTSIFGGRGNMLASVLAVLLIATVRTGMGLANVTAEYQLAVVGALLVFAVAIGNAARGLGRRRLRQE